MGTKRMVILMAAVAFLALFWVAGGVRAHLPAGEPIDQTGVTMASTMSLIMNYQGRLLDPASGDPKPDGTYTMTFRIYDVSTGGTALWSETKDVEVQSGLFNTVLGDVTPLPQGIFTGQDLWLGVKVGADSETSPRQQLLPVPYAIYASNADTVDGMEGADLEESAEIDADISVHAGDPDAHHAPYTDTEAWEAVLANDGAGSGLDADLVDGQHASAFAAASHTHSAADITSDTLSTARFSAYDDLVAEGKIGSGGDQVAEGAHDHDARYYTEGESDSRYVNVTGDIMEEGLVVFASESHGISAQTSSSATGAAGVEGKNIGDGYGVLAYSTNSHGVLGQGGSGSGNFGGYFIGWGGVAGFGDAGYGGYFNSTSGPALYAAGDTTVTGYLRVYGGFEAPRARYVPITVGDLMHSMGGTVYTGDCCNGVLFPDGSQSGGSITFPLPDDYVQDSEFHLDLYLIPLDSGSGELDFFVRFVGLNEGGWSGTGSSYTSAAVPVGTIYYIHKQSFLLPGFAAGSLPELVELTIRRHPDDTYAGDVTLVGLRLTYQALR